MRYTVLLLPDHDSATYTAIVPMLPGCITEGDTRELAIAAATEAARGWLLSAADRGIDIDIEPAGTEAVTIDVEMPVIVTAS